MPFRYSQFCALARAVEVIGERWTLLIVRELLLGPKRFSDLLERLHDISPSVLTERLTRAEKLGLITRAMLGPPARATVYELTDAGRALEPVAFGLIRWGARFLWPPRPGDRFEPEWLRLVFAAYAKKEESPPRKFGVRVRAGSKEALFYISGGPEGTRIHEQPQVTEALVTGSPEDFLGIMSGAVNPQDAVTSGRMRLEGSPATLRDLPELFDVQRPVGEVRKSRAVKKHN